MNNLIKKIEIATRTGNPKDFYGQLIQVWWETDPDLKELWVTELENNPNIASVFNVDHRKDFVIEGQEPNVSGLPAPCCIYIFGRSGADIIDTVFAALRSEPDTDNQVGSVHEFIEQSVAAQIFKSHKF